MAKTLANILDQRLGKVAFFSMALAICLVVPAFFHNPWVTGPLINATLLVAAVLVGPTEAVLLGLMPSTIALLAGLLPLPLAPMVPFIMIGNAVFVMVFHSLKTKNIFAALGVAAFLKFAFLHGSVVFLVSRLLDSGLTAKLAVMMSWPQLVTAIIGGAIAYPIVKAVQNK
jgi:hypothetical protein